MKYALISALALTLLASAVPARAQGASFSAPVYCGSFTPFQFKVSAAGKTADERANIAMDTINKFLGGKVGRVTTKPDPKDASSIRLMLNNELVALITPKDATAEKTKTVGDLAVKWMKLLTTAFNASKAQPG
jgi:hypothetical protein